ncbi:MAG: hypothetical protein R6U50_16590 [Desulfobacterales bacterium]
MNLCLSLPAEKTAVFYPILQDGLNIRTDIHCSVKQFLQTTFHISRDYIESRIPTIMLNGKAVDDLNTAFLEENSTLALSSAMPGLAGATLRRRESLSPMRSGITYREQKKPEQTRRGTLKIKFFNVLIRELGLKLLYQGIHMRGMDVAALLRQLINSLKVDCAQIILDDQEITMDELQKTKMFTQAGVEEVFFRVVGRI